MDAAPSSTSSTVSQSPPSQSKQVQHAVLPYSCIAAVQAVPRRTAPAELPQQPNSPISGLKASAPLYQRALLPSSLGTSSVRRCSSASAEQAVPHVQYRRYHNARLLPTGERYYRAPSAAPACGGEGGSTQQRRSRQAPLEVAHSPLLRTQRLRARWRLGSLYILMHICFDA